MRVVITGATGQLGHALTAARWPLDVQLHAFGRQDLDIQHTESMAATLGRIKPDIIVNAAAYTDVDGAEINVAACRAINCDAVEALALASRDLGAALIHISTDFVFDGTLTAPYRESDHVNPLNVYGRTKVEGEERLRRELPRHIILRTSWLFSARGRNFLTSMLRLGRERDEISVVADRYGCPTPAADLAAAIVAITTRMGSDSPVSWGTYHYCGMGATTWHGFAKRIFTAAAPWLGRTIRPIPIDSARFPTAARRPQSTPLYCQRIQDHLQITLPRWESAIPHAVREFFGEGRTQ